MFGIDNALIIHYQLLITYKKNSVVKSHKQQVTQINIRNTASPACVKMRLERLKDGIANQKRKILLTRGRFQMNRICKVILAAAAVVALAAPAMATDKLKIKGTDGITDVFKVDDAGAVTTGSAMATTSFLAQFINSATVRSGLRADGVQYWQLNTGPAGGNAEAGQLMYSTPAGFPAIVLYTVGWANQFNWANFGTYAGFYFQSNKNLPTLSVATSAAPENGRVGIGQVAPTQKLEVNGGLRLNPASVTTSVPFVATTAAPAKPGCDVNARGTLWYVNNGAAKDNLQVCVYTGSGYLWTNIY